MPEKPLLMDPSTSLSKKTYESWEWARERAHRRR